MFTEELNKPFKVLMRQKVKYPEPYFCGAYQFFVVIVIVITICLQYVLKGYPRKVLEHVPHII